MFAELLERHIDKQDAPDLIISVLYAGGEVALVKRLNDFGIPFFTVNTSIDRQVIAQLGKPGEKMQNWAAHISPDEQRSAGILLEEMYKLSNGKNVLAIAGHSQSAVNHQRLQGLAQKVAALKLNLAPPIFTDWSKADAYRAARTLFQRVEKHDMIWTAGPSIAAAVKELIAQNPAYQAENIVIGTFDWSAEAIELVKSGAVQLSFGGHFMEAGWALVLAHDFLNGVSISADSGNIIYSELKRLDSANVQLVEKQVNPEYWQNIDFRQYSKCYVPSIKQYDFRLGIID